MTRVHDAPGRVYLDWNATTPPHADVIDAMAEAARTAWANPSSIHAAGRAARQLVEDAREAVAGALDVAARDVIFTSGATEANNIALRGAASLVTSRLEHPSVTRVAEALEAEGRPVQWLPVGSGGVIDPGDVERALSVCPEGTVVAVAAANHETGAIQPVRAVLEIAHGAGARVHVDAAQAFGKITPEGWSEADSLALASHKIRGPKGIGALVWGCGPPPGPVLVGGAQERGIRPGTVDPVASAGLAVAVRRAADGGPARYASLRQLRDALEQELSSVAEVNAIGAPRMPHVASLAFAGWPGDELVAALDLAGVSVSSGSACSAGTPEPPAAVAAMHGIERARRTVRLSLGEETEATEIDFVISVLKRLVTVQLSSS